MIDEVKYTIAEDFELPSKGAIYSKAVNPHVRLRSMTIREEMIRQAPTKATYKMLSDIIEGCMLEKPAIHVYDMCIGDFEYLLHKLRVVTYGENYKMTVMCPYCGNVEDIDYNLDKEETLEFDIDKFNELKTVTLRNNKVVTLKFKTPRIEDNIKLKTDELSSNSKESLNFELLAKLEEAIDLVDGQKLSYIQLEEFINHLSAADSNKLEQRFDKLSKMIGLKGEINYTCSNPKCGMNNLTFFRFGPEFFRPTED